VEGERAVRVDVEKVLGRVLLLGAHRVAHAVARRRRVGEGDTRGGDGNRFCWALDLLVRDLDVDIERRGAVAVEGDRVVDDERHAAAILAGGRGGRDVARANQREAPVDNLLPLGGERLRRRVARLHLEHRIAIRVEGERAVRVDVEKVLGRVLLLAAQRVAHAVPGRRRVGERDASARHSRRLARALDLLVRDLDVQVEVGRARTVDFEGDVDDERDGRAKRVRRERRRRRVSKGKRGSEGKH